MLAAVHESFAILGQSIPAAINPSGRILAADCFKPFLEKLFHTLAVEKIPPLTV